MSKIFTQLLIFAFIAGVIGFFTWNFKQQLENYPPSSPTGKYSLIVESGDSLSSITSKLVEDKVVYNTQAISLNSGKFALDNLQKGEYELELPAKPIQILEQIDKQNQQKSQAISEVNSKPTAKATFKEGYTLDQVINELANQGIGTKSELQEYAANPANFDSQKYPFLPSPLDCKYGEMSSCAKYYIEGFVYPDTYIFFKPSTPKEIFSKVLDNFNTKVWTKIKDKVKDKDSFYKALIMASVIEKETGRPVGGINSSNLDEVNTERKTMSGVFFNRLEQNMAWQSDPTGTYWSGKRFCQQTLTKLDGCIYLDSPEAKNKYNTYTNKGYPIGPITSPQVANIVAALEPIANDNLFFVSDCTGTKYFAQTNKEHTDNIAMVQKFNKEKCTQ